MIALSFWLPSARDVEVESRQQFLARQAATINRTLKSGPSHFLLSRRGVVLLFAENEKIDPEPIAKGFEDCLTEARQQVGEERLSKISLTGLRVVALRGPAPFFALDAWVHGVFVPTHKLVVLSTLTRETAAHECRHAVSYFLGNPDRCTAAVGHRRGRDFNCNRVRGRD